MNIKQLITLVTIIFAGLAVALQAETNDLHLFILSGQSNMAKLNHKVSFLPTVEKEFSAQNVIVVKDAHGAQPIRRWYKKWKPAEGVPVVDRHASSGWYKRLKEKRGINGDDHKDANGVELIPQGVFYETLMEAVEEKLGDKKPTTITFVWMQGESDAKDHYAVYAESFKGLVQQLRDDLNHKDINVVIGRITDSKLGNPGTYTDNQPAFDTALLNDRFACFSLNTKRQQKQSAHRTHKPSFHNPISAFGIIIY
ncbi:sialate O-acetylesterase, partial [Verrucomicrobiota bacterium]